MERRDFLKGIAAAALTAGFIGPSEARAYMNGNIRTQNILPEVLQPVPTIKAFQGTERFWSQVKQTFVLPDNYLHFNTGTTGSQPLFSLVNLGVYNLYKSMDPRDWQTNLNKDFPDLFPFVNKSALTARQKAVAKQYNANTDEIVLSYNTTDACNLIFAGTPWKSGDRIVCTQMEHGALAGPIAWARDNFGVEVRIITIPSKFTANILVQDIVDLFDAQLRDLPDGNKQYIATSEVFYKNGLRMPVAEICALSAKYPQTYSIIDSAHGWGMLPVDCHGYGADFISGAGHKWLCGGPGTGISYIRNSGNNLPPFAMGNFVSYGNLFTVPSSNFNSRAWSPASSVQNRGELNTPALYAMTDSAAYFNYLGVPAIYNRGVALGNYLKDKIAAQWPGSLWVEKNPDPRFATALTAFNPFRLREDASQMAAMTKAMNSVLATLAGEDPKIYIRTVTWRDQISDTADNRITFRVSTHGVYNNYQQIDYMFGRLVAAVEATGLALLE